MITDFVDELAISCILFLSLNLLNKQILRTNYFTYRRLKCIQNLLGRMRIKNYVIKWPVAHHYIQQSFRNYYLKPTIQQNEIFIETSYFLPFSNSPKFKSCQRITIYFCNFVQDHLCTWIFSSRLIHSFCFLNAMQHKSRGINITKIKRYYVKLDLCEASLNFWII